MVVNAFLGYFRKRRQRTKTSPSDSPKTIDLEQQLGFHHSRKNSHEQASSTNSSRGIDNIYYSQSRPSTPSTPALTPDHIPPRVSSYANSSKASSVRSLPAHDSRSDKKHRRQPSTQSLSSKAYSSPSTPPPPPTPTLPATPTTPLPAPVKTPTASPSSTPVRTRRNTVVERAIENQPTDCHIDMLDVDVETLMPTIVSEEIPPVPIVALQQLRTRTPTQTSLGEDQASLISRQGTRTPSPTIRPIPSSTPIMPTPTPRRPPMATRKSCDSYTSARLSMSHLPPPPPPSMPPPAIPFMYSASIHEGRSGRISADVSPRSSLYAVSPSNPRGRRPRASTESASSARRSISLDSTNPRDEVVRAKANRSPLGMHGSRTTRKILPPSTPPPTPPASRLVPSAFSTIPVHARRKGHQKSPSQITSAGYMGPLSPLSPPLSPMTVQIPRNMQSPSSSRTSLIIMPGQPFPHHATNNVLHIQRPDSPTTGYNPPTPTAPNSVHPHAQYQQQNSAFVKVKVQSIAQSRRLRSKSISQTEAHRLVGASVSGLASLAGGPFSPPLPRFTPTPPPMSMSMSNLLSSEYQPRRPSLTQQSSYGSSSWGEGSSRPSTATPTTSASFLKTFTEEEEGGESSSSYRSGSMDWIRSIPTTPTSPTAARHAYGLSSDDVASSVSTTPSQRYSILCNNRDLEVQAIIGEALAIAMAKSTGAASAASAAAAATAAARHSNLSSSAWQRHQHHQRYQQCNPNDSHHGSTSRPWTPSEDGWTGATTSISSSRSESPLQPIPAA